jgi:hypothetical protein
VYLKGKAGQLIFIPRQWTSLAAPDPVVVLGAGRAQLRADDLLQLAALIDSLRPSSGASTRRRR